MTIDQTYPILIFRYDGWLFMAYLYLPSFLGDQYHQNASSRPKCTYHLFFRDQYQQFIQL